MVCRVRRTNRPKHRLAILLIAVAGCRQDTETRLDTPLDVPALETKAQSTDSQNLEYVEQRPFLTREVDYYQADPLVGHVHLPNARREFEWQEHPRGEIVFRTNNLGFREDADTEPQARQGVERVLVTGDSHIDGVVWNQESYPNLLEGLLQVDGQEVEVLNGAAGYYSPYNYRRLLEKHAGLGLSTVIVTFYTGNDFLESGVVLESTGHANNRPEDYWPTFNSLPKRLRQVAGQHLNQTFYLNTFPHMQQETLDFAIGELEAMSLHATDLGATIIVLLLPSKLDVESNERDLAEAGEALKLEDEQLRINQTMTERLKGRLQTAGIPYIDLLPLMRGRSNLYWERDHHLSLEGHRVIAELLATGAGNIFDDTDPAPKLN